MSAAGPSRREPYVGYRGRNGRSTGSHACCGCSGRLWVNLNRHQCDENVSSRPKMLRRVSDEKGQKETSSSFRTALAQRRPITLAATALTESAIEDRPPTTSGLEDIATGPVAGPCPIVTALHATSRKTPGNSSTPLNTARVHERHHTGVSEAFGPGERFCAFRECHPK